jgi:DOMON domain
VSRGPDRFPLASLAAGAVLGVGLALTLHLPQALWALVSPQAAVHRLDGVAAPGEYRFEWADPASKLAFRWSIAGDRLIGAVSSPDTGWVAVGFGGAGPLMFGADIVLGWVDARGAHVEDHFANTPTSHVADSTIGGRNDILGSAGAQTAAGTTIEFERPLAAHDSTDHAIEAGQTKVMIAAAESDDPMAYHLGGHKAVALLDLFAGPPAKAAAGVGLPDHLTDVQIMLACWMAVLLIVGVHGVLANWAEATSPEAAAAEPPGFAIALLVGLVVLEVAALGTFAVGVRREGPVWLLGSALATGLLALAGIVVVYTRVLVRWQLVRTERDDGIPW